LEDFIYDIEWKEILKEEFSKNYFLVLNKILDNTYEKGLVRPNKELIFNALNSTKLSQVYIKVKQHSIISLGHN
jgi:uracil-DNA glycosylase